MPPEASTGRGFAGGGGELKIDDPRQAALTLGNLINGIAFHARLVGGYAEGPHADHLATCHYGVDTLLRAYQV
ncbi:hypothetical protein G6F57_017871 [Rhizopus arrhizus]|nr:hypothetical protein G6F57_017871 [Rhizopus arrhizus]